MQLNELQIYVVYIKQGLKRSFKIHETQNNCQIYWNPAYFVKLRTQHLFIAITTPLFNEWYCMVIIE